jgi:hypothetical protein
MATKDKRRRTKARRADVADAELAAMAKVLDALKHLNAAVQQSVIEWAVRRFKLQNPFGSAQEEPMDSFVDLPESAKRIKVESAEPARESQSSPQAQDGQIEGINAVAQKWLKRSGLSESQLSKLFTLGVDDIVLVAKKVPGSKKIERLKNVLLLEGVAAFLGSGVARVEWSKLKESAAHYNADVGGNFPTYMKKLAAEATGSVQNGYTVTSRGLNQAKELIEQMSTPQK